MLPGVAEFFELMQTAEAASKKRQSDILLFNKIRWERIQELAGIARDAPQIPMAE